MRLHNDVRGVSPPRKRAGRCVCDDRAQIDRKALFPQSIRMFVEEIMNAVAHRKVDEHGTEWQARTSVSLALAEAIIETWSRARRSVAHRLLQQYGPPHELTPTKLFWYCQGPWKRILISSDVVMHDDGLTQWIDYQVPLERFADVARYEGSCLVDRKAGEVAARGQCEAANFITLNLMHEIVVGQKTVEEASRAHAKSMAELAGGRFSPYAERLLLPISGG